MAVTDPVILPPSLALDEEPLDAGHLDEIVSEVVNEAESSGLSPAEVLESWIADARAGVATRDAWFVDGDGPAEWAMRKLAEIDANLAALDEQAVAYADKIRTWHSDARRRVSVQRAFFAGHLERYGIAVREANPKRSTIVLPSGKIATTDNRAKVEVADDETLIEWVDENLPATVADVIAPTSRRVLISELRKIATVADQPTGRVTLLAACGCSSTLPGEDTIDLVDAGTMRCPTEQHDLQPIVDVVVESRHVAVTETGETVPGVTITERHYSAKATPA